MSDAYPPPGQQPQWGQQPPPQGWQQPPGPGWGGPPPPPKKNKVGLLVGLGCGGALLLLVVFVAIGLAVGDGDTTAKSKRKDRASTPSSAPADDAPAKGKPSAPAKRDDARPADDGPKGDAKITGCRVEPTTTWPSAEVAITNRSSKTSNYIVSVEFVNSAGTRLGEGMAAANQVAPGQKVQKTAQSLDDTTGKITCKVLKVTRYASGG
jgi:hypothetical protein